MRLTDERIAAYLLEAHTRRAVVVSSADFELLAQEVLAARRAERLTARARAEACAAQSALAPGQESPQ